MQYDTLKKVKILIHDDKSYQECYIALKDVVLFIDPEKNKEISLGDYLNFKDKELETLKATVKKQGEALAKFTAITSKLNLKI